MAVIPELTAERLRELLSYDPQSGVFTWLVHMNNKRAHVGLRAGQHRRHGYRTINLNGRRYYEHRLAWLYVHGHWPARYLDHINGDGTDNRLANLREATPAQNSANKGAMSNSRTGLKGVSRFRKRWTAEICVNGVKHRLGFFDTPEEAALAYAMAAPNIHGDFARIE